MNRDKFTLISKVRLIAWTSFFVVGFVFSAEKDNSFLEEISQEEIQAIVSGKKPCNLAEEIKLFQSTNAVVTSPDTLRDPEYVSIKIMNELLVFCKLSKVSFESEMNKFKKQNKEQQAILLKETFLFLYSTFIKIRTIKMMKDFNLSYAPLNLKINKMTSFIDLFIKKQHSCSTLEVVLFGKLEKIVSELLPLIDNDKLKEYFALTSPNNYLSSLYRLKDSCELLRSGQGTQLASLLPELLDTIAYLVVNYSTVFLTEVESFCVIEKKPKKVNFSSSMIKLLQYVLLCQTYAFTNQDALEEHENALIAIYELFYEYAEKNNLRAYPKTLAFLNIRIEQAI